MRQAKIITLVVLLLVALTLILQNWEPVKTKVLLWSLEPPLAALLLGTLVVGYCLGLLTTALVKVRTWRSEALAARKLASTPATSAQVATAASSSNPTSTDSNLPN